MDRDAEHQSLAKALLTLPVDSNACFITGELSSSVLANLYLAFFEVWTLAKEDAKPVARIRRRLGGPPDKKAYVLFIEPNAVKSFESRAAAEHFALANGWRLSNGD